MNDIENLMKIWDEIPLIKKQQNDFPKDKLMNDYIDLFNFGSYFYVIFNTKTTQIEYISNEITNILGYTKDLFQLQFLLNNIHTEDLPYYYHYQQYAVRFFSNLPQDLLFKYKFAYDYRIKTSEGDYKRILQQVIPIQYLNQGGARTLTIFTDISHLNISGIPKLSFIGLKGAKSYYNIHLQDELTLAPKLFTDRELQVLQFMIKGLKSEYIAAKLNISIHTVRNHRKNILRKSKCKNLQELLVQTIREGWV